MNQRELKIGPIGTIIGILFIAILAWVAFKTLLLVYCAGLFLIPFLLLGTYFLKKSVLHNWWGSIMERFQYDKVSGTMNLLSKFILLPFTSFFLLGKAFVLYKSKDIQSSFAQQFEQIKNENTPYQKPESNLEGDYVEYEEVD